MLKFLKCLMLSLGMLWAFIFFFGIGSRPATEPIKVGSIKAVDWVKCDRDKVMEEIYLNFILIKPFCKNVMIDLVAEKDEFVFYGRCLDEMSI